MELGPGLIGSIYDGIQRPLDRIRDMAGDRISRGLEAPGLDREREWDFVPRAGVGSKVVPGGDILGTVQETPVVEHRVMVPPGISGKVIWIHKGVAKVTDVIAKIETSDGVREIQMMQRWPVRHGRPIAHKLTPSEPLVSGQRVLDTFFPVAKGGTACIPGPFGSGKTVVQHQLAKWLMRR